MADTKTPAWPRAERVALADKMTLVLERLPDGKIRVKSNSINGGNDPAIVLKGEILEIRAMDTGLRVARKDRLPDAGDPPIAPYDPYGPGATDDDLLIESDASHGDLGGKNEAAAAAAAAETAFGDDQGAGSGDRGPAEAGLHQEVNA